MLYLSAIYNLIDGSIEFNGNCTLIDEGDVIINVFGEAYSTDKSFCIRELYLEYGSDITKHIVGNYIIIIYNKSSKEILVIQDMLTSPLTFYYTVYGSKVYMGTSVKDVLKRSMIKRQINMNAIYEFEVNGFIHNKDTLIENLYKIEPYSALSICYYDLKQINIEYQINENTEEEAKKIWHDVFAQVFQNEILNNNDICMPLSSGYDSNYILYNIHKLNKGVINAYCVGGALGTNELPQVRENVKAYKDVILHELLVTDDTLKYTPDIVWRLEGALFERGIFLQYIMAKRLCSEKREYFICGECADQVFNKDFFYRLRKGPYELASFIILKKSGILLNSFDIRPCYPYLNCNVISLAKATKSINETKKIYHKEKCNEVLPEIVRKNLKKVGGSTDMITLFGKNDNVIKYFRIVKKNHLYIINNNRRKIYKIKRYCKETIKMSIRTLLNFLKIRKYEKVDMMFKNNERSLNELLTYLYLIVFEELFISGRYDKYFDLQGIDFKLDDVIYCMDKAEMM